MCARSAFCAHALCARAAFCAHALRFVWAHNARLAGSVRSAFCAHAPRLFGHTTRARKERAFLRFVRTRRVCLGTQRALARSALCVYSHALRFVWAHDARLAGSVRSAFCSHAPRLFGHTTRASQGACVSRFFRTRGVFVWRTQRAPRKERASRVLFARAAFVRTRGVFVWRTQRAPRKERASCVLSARAAFCSHALRFVGRSLGRRRKSFERGRAVRPDPVSRDGAQIPPSRRRWMGGRRGSSRTTRQRPSSRTHLTMWGCVALASPLTVTSDQSPSVRAVSFFGR